MGNSHSDKRTLLELCNVYENLLPKFHQENSSTVNELNEKISKKISEYRTTYKLYTDEDILEYETLILFTEKENIFYKKDSSSITEIQYALNSYLKSKIKPNMRIVLDILSCFPSPETRTIGKFCVDNNICYQNFILYDKNKTIKNLRDTKIYTLYQKLKQIALKNKFDINLSFMKEQSTIEVTITNPVTNKRIKYIENVTPYTDDVAYLAEGVYYKDIDFALITQLLKS